MSSLKTVGRAAAARKNDRVALCSFTFSDGRRCRTPRAAKHPRFCFYHAQKETRARAAVKLGKDLAYFFSGDYVSGCDLSTALARLIPAVVRGDVKPRTARTVAYLAQTLMQAIHIGQHEYINAFGTEDWRKSIRNSVNGNYNHRFPPAPQPEQSALSAPPTNPPAESPQPQPASPPPQPAVIPNPVAPLANEGEGPASSPTTATSAVPIALATPAEFAVAPAAPAAPSNPACHSERSEGSQPIPAAPSASREEPRPAAAPQTGPSGLPVLAPLPPPKLEAPPAQANNPHGSPHPPRNPP